MTAPDKSLPAALITILLNVLGLLLFQHWGRYAIDTLVDLRVDPGVEPHQELVNLGGIDPAEAQGRVDIRDPQAARRELERRGGEIIEALLRHLRAVLEEAGRLPESDAVLLDTSDLGRNEAIAAAIAIVAARQHG